MGCSSSLLDDQESGPQTWLNVEPAETCEPLARIESGGSNQVAKRARSHRRTTSKDKSMEVANSCDVSHGDAPKDEAIQAATSWEISNDEHSPLEVKPWGADVPALAV